MKIEIVAIKDSKSREWSRPTFEQTIESAMRSFGILCADDKSQSLPSLYPADFDLWHFGSFDTATGVFDVLPSAVHLANGVDFKGA